MEEVFFNHLVPETLGVEPLKTLSTVLGLKIRAWSKVLPWLPIVAFIVVSAFANSDLTVGRFALFMDERITFDGVRAILKAESFADFVYAIGDGGDNRYGRILWYSMAIVSWLPELVFGAPGQIIASRMFQSVLLGAAIALLAFGLFRTTLARLTFASIALLIPFTSYYSSMPKPEPLQMLLLALFFFVAFRKETRKFFGWHWILLGLAFGAKISTLPAIAVILLVSLMTVREKSSAKVKFQSALYFIAGLGIAVPTLALPAGLIAVAGFVYQKLDSGKFSHTNYVLTLLALVGSIALGFQAQLSFWIAQTFLNTGHGADQESINFFSWIQYLLFEWLSQSPWLSIPLAISWGIFIVLVASTFRRGSFSIKNPELPGLLVFATGTALSISIMLTAQRLWGMYLFPGFLLQLAGIFALIDSSRFHKFNLLGRPSWLSKLTAGLVVLATFFVTAFSWLPSELTKYSELTSRTQSSSYKADYESYLELEDFLNNHRKDNDQKMVVLVSPGLFHRESDNRYEVFEFFGPYSYWSERPDVLVLSQANTPQGTPYPSDSPEFDRYLQEQAGYAAQVKTSISDCLAEPCFQIAENLANGGQILVPSP